MTEEKQVITPLNLVGEFIYKFQASLDPRLWISLCHEEASEIKAEEVGTPEYLKEVCDSIYVAAGLALTTNQFTGDLLLDEDRKKLVEIAEFLEKSKIEAKEFYGEKVLNQAFLAVHASNMSKLDDDGKPIRREDGKIIKGPNYQAPDIKAIIEAAKDDN